MTGVHKTPTVVVRTYAPRRRLFIVCALALLGIFVLYFSYELGRYDAGYDRMAVAQQRVELEVAKEHLEKDNRTLRAQLAELDTVRIGRAREQAEVARSLGDLQAQVARQGQELAFYRGVVAEGANELGVKIQQLHIAPVPDKSGVFKVTFALVRTGRPDDSLSGSIGLSVESDASEGPTSLDLLALTSGAQRERPFTFRYLENVDLQIALPSGFRAQRLTVEVRSSRKSVTPLRQTFLWTVDRA